jgi:hypothetical protein
MPPEARELDLILKIRLDVLDQAVEEVKRVITEVTDQAARLAAVEEFLFSAGDVGQAVKKLNVNLGDVQTRVAALLDDQSSAADAARPTGAHQPAPSLSEGDRQLLSSVQEAAASATWELKELTARRAGADTSFAKFQEIWRWSVAGLRDDALQEAVRDYQMLIDRIRTADKPWRHYHSVMPRLDDKLFSRYLELVGSIAVRGFGLDPNGQSDVHTLIWLVKGPEHRTAESPRSPLALMSSLGRRHIPLGYPAWSLWALPLLGRTAGEQVVASLLPKECDHRLRVICGDLYAQYVLGPSYLHAAIFLEFDPRAEAPRANLPPDSLRATVLLRNLREYGAGDSTDSQLIEGIAAPVEREWRRARAAVGGQERDLDTEDREVVDGFVRSLTNEYGERGFQDEDLAGLPDAATDLLMAGQDDSAARVSAMPLRDLMGAMWIARLREPSKARLIHGQAKTATRQGQGKSPNHIGLGTSPRGTQWA